MSSNSNLQKIDAYYGLDTADRHAHHLAYITKMWDWIRSDLPQTCDAALRLLHSVPPVKLGGTSVKTKDMSKTEMAVSPLKCTKLVPDWMDQVVADVDFSAIIIPKTQRINMTGMFMLNRKEPLGPDTVEQTVDDMHKRWVLEPAAAIAGIVMGKDLEVTYAPQTGGSATDLRVCDKQHTEGPGRNHIVAEDKRGRVWLEHESKVLELLEGGNFPSYSKQHDPKPEPAVRICVQIYVQMHKFQAFYGKIFSPCGVIYVRTGASADMLEFSRIYHDLDDDVRRTACLIIEAERHPSGQYPMFVPAFIRSISDIWPFRIISAWFYRQILQLLLQFQTLCSTPTVAVGRLEGHWSLYKALSPWPSLKFPIIFSTPLGAGASGDVWLSNDGNHVIKLFMNRDAAEHEANILLKCQERPGPAVATFHGLYSDGWRFGLVMRYVGSAIGPLGRAPLEQRQQLLAALYKLHSYGIHHHDVRPANVMVDNSGVVTLIDFDRAEEVYGECRGCPDLEAIALLETSTSGADSEREIIPYL
ncbi:hypothetical protein B0H14DRAFT_3891954 [Mycena olivaceomarginata]|nr:hypothetical protein B0H14DRAFT_3891954 [Mycena olivaceomarginata]